MVAASVVGQRNHRRSLQTVGRGYMIRICFGSSYDNLVLQRVSGELVFITHHNGILIPALERSKSSADPELHNPPTKP